MNVARLLRSLALPLVLLLPACGGGGGASLGGGIGGTGLVVGEITDLGSIVVNGVTIDPSTATILEDGQVVGEDDLEVGMVVEVRASLDGTSGTATQVVIDDVVTGVVQAKPDASTLVVNGQSVQILPTTVFDDSVVPPSLAGIAVGDLVEVHGFVRGPGIIEATRIEAKASLLRFELEGIVGAVDAGAMTFTVGMITVDYGMADTGDLPGGVPVSGDRVEIDAQPALDGMGRLVAIRVELDGPDLDEIEEAEVEGYVTAIASPTAFTVGSVDVSTTPSTRFEGGLPGDIVLGLKVEVEGSFSMGVLVATKVSFRASVKLEGDVASVGGSSLTLVGLGGLTVTIDRFTEFDTDSDTFTDIEVGDHVEVRAIPTGATSVLATRLRERSADTDVILQGPVDAMPAPSDPLLSILGVSVDTSAVADNEFEDSNETIIGRAAFFAAVEAGDLVKVEGTLAGTTITWDEVEFED